MGCCSSKKYTRKTKNNSLTESAALNTNSSAVASQSAVVASDKTSVKQNDVRKARPPRISVALTTTTHLKLLKSVNELNESDIDVTTSVDLRKEEENALFIKGLENPMKFSASL